MSPENSAISSLAGRAGSLERHGEALVLRRRGPAIAHDARVDNAKMPILLLMVCLPYVDVAVESVEGMSLAARADAERRGAVHVHDERAALAPVALPAGRSSDSTSKSVKTSPCIVWNASSADEIRRGT